MALGAQSAQVLQLVVNEGFRPILAGIVLGVLRFRLASRARFFPPYSSDSVPSTLSSFAGVSLLLITISRCSLPGYPPAAQRRSILWLH